MFMRKISKMKPQSLLVPFLLLIISETTMIHAASPPLETNTRPTSANAYTYTVRTGDSLYGIARRYNLSIESIKRANCLASDRIYVGQLLIIPLAETIPGSPSPSSSPPAVLPDPVTPDQSLSVQNITIKIDKSDYLLTLIINGKMIKTYCIALGDGGPGDKLVSGDHKTPEGEFFITEKRSIENPDSTIGSRWIRLSYPNTEDAKRGLKLGLINQNTYNEIIDAITHQQTPPQYTPLGSAVGIHGGATPAKGRNWTWGSVAMSDSDIEELYTYVQIGTIVIIQK